MTITASDVTNALQPIIAESPFGDGEVIELNNGFVYVSMLATLFESAADMSSTSLLAVDSANGLGYADHINSWKTAGYIS